MLAESSEMKRRDRKTLISDRKKLAIFLNFAWYFEFFGV